jgi:hypothetical protein
MESRAFGAGRRTSYAGTRFGRRELAVTAAALGAVAIFIGLRFGAVPMDWYPYPSLGLPPIEPVAVLGCLGLVLPALLERPR